MQYDKEDNIMELKDRGLEVYEARKEKMKQIQKKKKEDEENYKKKLEHYGKCILNVFNASNLEQDSDILVWSINVKHLASEKIQCKVDFAPEGAEERMLFGLEELKKWENSDKVEKVIATMQVIEAFESTPTIVKDIGEFLFENLDANYRISFNEADEFNIFMGKPTISEEE